MKYEYNCLMANFNIPDWNDLVSGLIDENDIYDNAEHEFGLETDPHVTVLFGILPEIKLTKVKKYLIPPHFIDIYITKISIFENKEYDVVKFDIESEWLHKLNKRICDNIPHETDYPNYIPHMTICYCKPGTGKKYTKTLKNPINILAEKYSYSTTDGNKKYLTDKDFSRNDK